MFKGAFLPNCQFDPIRGFSPRVKLVVVKDSLLDITKSIPKDIDLESVIFLFIANFAFILRLPGGDFECDTFVTSLSIVDILFTYVAL